MSIDPKLLHILRCPVSKQKLKIATENELLQLNALISNQELFHNNDSAVSEPLKAALITENRQIVYKISNGIPIMLEDEGIPTVQIDNW